MDYSWFKDEILILTGIDLSLYKENQMKRRIDALIARCGCDGYTQYLNLLKLDSEKLAYFCDYITINVTGFFRNIEHWKVLEEKVLPNLQHPRIWSVACSEGQEAYSLVMALSKYHPLEDIHVLATDINDKVLSKARKGVYPACELEEVPEEFRQKFFEEVPEGYRVCAQVRKCVEFCKMNILEEELGLDDESFDLVVCRNVLIYFTDEAKRHLFNLFHNVLKDGGILFTGKTEQLLYHKNYGFDKICNYLYSKIELSR